MLTIAILALLILGFFFTPAWLLLLGGVIYLFASWKSRRADAVESRIKRMVAEGRTQAISSNLFFETARSYALSKGAKAAEDNAASTYYVMDGTTYFVTFTRAANGGTMLSVRKLGEVRGEMLAHIAASPPAPTEAPPSAPDTFEIAGITFRGNPKSDDLMKEVVHKIIDEVDKRIKLDEHSYHYVMEEAEWAADKNSFCQDLLVDTGLLKIEYEGAREWARDRSDKRTAPLYMEAEVWPDLLQQMGEFKATCMRAVIFGGILERNRTGVDALRGKYAAAFVRHLTNSGEHESAIDWNRVIECVSGKPAHAS